MTDRSGAIRDRYNAFIATHEVAWELVMGALAAAYVAVGFASDDASPSMRPTLEMAEVGLTVIFVLEFATRFAAARDRVSYVRSHWIDLLALVPTARGARLLRLFRLLRLVRTFAGVYRALNRWERIATNRSLIGLFLAWLAVAVICASALYLAESGVNPNIADPVDAIWWGVVTLTTVGYGDVFPVTPEGRLAAAVLMILGITLFAGITGTITSLILRSDDAAPASAGQTLRELALLHADGLVTDSEYATKKAEILARM